MSKNNLNGSRSVSSNSFNSFMSDGEIIESGLEDLSLSSKNNRPSSTSKTQKAKRIRFYQNGNKFFNGIVIPVAPERYRSFDSLTSELTNIMTKNVTLPSGVRNVYGMDGKKVSLNLGEGVILLVLIYLCQQEMGNCLYYTR
nr:unnamed protein product [Callosobruchus analis]